MAFRRRGFRRRFFKRKPTEWIDGASFRFNSPAGPPQGFPLVPHFDATPTIDGHTVEIPLFPDEGLEAADSYTLLRVVGEIIPLVTREDDQSGEQILETFGADIRGTISTRRVYANAAVAGAQVHPFTFSALGLGEEDILNTRRWLQPMNDPQGNTPVTPPPMVIDDMLAIMTIHDLSAVLPGAIATSQFNERMVDTLVNPVRCMYDISCRRNVTRDTRPFLYFDVRDAAGETLDPLDQHHLHLSGYLRLLVRRR